MLVLARLRSSLISRTFAALLDTSHSALDRIIDHLVPLLDDVLTPDTSRNKSRMWIIDGTLIPVQDKTITAPARNYRRSISTQIITCADGRRVITVGHCQPCNRNDVVVAPETWPTCSTAPARSSAMATAAALIRHTTP